MRSLIRFILLISLCAFFTTCKKDHMLDCIKSAGDEVSQVRKAANFSIVNIRDNVDVRYHADSVFRIKVTAGIHLIDGIITELSGNTLYIRNENRCNWVRSFKNKYTVDIYAPSISVFTNYGSGDIVTVDTLRGAEITCESKNGSGTYTLLLNVDKANLFNHTGRADFKVSGRTGLSYIYINDTGVLDAGQLTSNYTYIRSSTTGKCTVRTVYDLGVEIRSVGNIYYYGTPVNIAKEITGTGSLISI